MMDRDTKLIAILRRQSHYIDGVGRKYIPYWNIFSPNSASIWCGIAVSKSQIVFKILQVHNPQTGDAAQL